MDASFNGIIVATVARISEMDHVGVNWYMNGHGLKVDASFVALGVALQVNGNIVKSASWLHPAGNTKHNNLVELDAMIKDVNLALPLQVSLLHLITDSACVHH